MDHTNYFTAMQTYGKHQANVIHESGITQDPNHKINDTLRSPSSSSLSLSSESPALESPRSTPSMSNSPAQSNTDHEKKKPVDEQTITQLRRELQIVQEQLKTSRKLNRLQIQTSSPNQVSPFIGDGIRDVYIEKRENGVSTMSLQGKNSLLRY